MAGCVKCGAPVEGKSRFCTGVECKRVRARERKRASRSGKPAEAAVVPLPKRERARSVPENVEELGSSTGGTVVDSTLRQLHEADRVDSPAGQVALVLAKRLDFCHMETGAGVASLAKQHAASLAEALKGAPRAASRLDEVRARREARLGRSG